MTTEEITRRIEALTVLIRDASEFLVGEQRRRVIDKACQALLDVL